MKQLAKVALVGVIALSFLSASMAPAGASTRRQQVVGERHGVYKVHFRTWTRNYPWVHIETKTQYGYYAPEPVTATVHIRCAQGWRRTYRWFDGDGLSSRYIYIRANQGRCYETVNAWTDDGARLWAALLVHHYWRGRHGR